MRAVPLQSAGVGTGCQKPCNQCLWIETLLGFHNVTQESAGHWVTIFLSCLEDSLLHMMIGQALQ